jgi:hypothetical protein
LFRKFGFRCQVSAQPPAKKTAGQIEIETFGTRFQNLPFLGFALRIRTGKMQVGLSATKPNKVRSRLNPTFYEGCQVLFLIFFKLAVP